MLYYIFGTDNYRINQKKKELEKEKKEKKQKSVVDLEKKEIIDFLQEIKTVSLLNPERFWLVKNASKNNSQKRLAEFFTQHKNFYDKEDFVFTEEKPDKKTSIHKFLFKNAESFELNELTEAELKAWVKKYVASKGGEIDSRALNKFLLNNNKNLWFLSMELDKLLAFNKQISLESVDKLTASSFDDNIFNLTDAVGEGNVTKALELINLQLDSGVEPLYLLAMLTRQFRILIMVKERIGSVGYVDYNLIAKQIKQHPFVVKKSLAQARNFSMADLKDKYNKIKDIDKKLKSSKISPEVLFNLLIID